MERDCVHTALGYDTFEEYLRAEIGAKLLGLR